MSDATAGTQPQTTPLRFRKTVAGGTSLMRLAACAALPLLLATLLNAGEVPLGHPDFYPSPERPVGWRGDGNGAFPGATLVDRFGDGPLAIVDLPPGKHYTRLKAKDIITLAKADPVNVVWKISLPGFTQSQPIIVGHKVIQTCEPGLMLCFDINTGKELWRYDMNPLLIDKLPPAEIERAYKLMGIIRTMHAIRANLGGNYSRFGPATPESLAIWKDRAATMLALAKEAQALGAGDAAVTRCQTIIALLDGLQADGKDPGMAKQFDVHSLLAKDYYKKYKIHATSHWYSWIGDAWPTPVCDGKYLYTFTSQGAVLCLDLDGKLVWSQRLIPPASVKMPRPASPLLVGDVLFVPFFTTHAFDKKTGKQLWVRGSPSESADDDPSEGGNTSGEPVAGGGVSALNPKVVTLPDGKKAIAACFKKKLVVFDPATARILVSVDVPSGAHDPGPSVMSSGDIIFSPFNGWAGRMSGTADALTLTELWTRGGSGVGSHILQDTRIFISSSCLDLESGKELATAGKLEKGFTGFTGRWKPSLAVGDRVLAIQNIGWGDDGMKGSLGRQYGTSNSFAILSQDGKVISKDNLLNSAMPPAVPWVPEAARDLLNEGHLNDQNGGIPTNFGFGSGFAQGNRVVIPGLSHLWCIGDPNVPFNGTAGPTRR